MSDHGKHTRSPGYEPNGHWVVCMRCAKDYRAYDMRKEWTGLIVCDGCWDPRHPQDFVRSVPDDMRAYGLVNPAEAMEEAPYCTTYLAIADYAIAGCAIADDTYGEPSVIPTGTFTQGF